MSQSDGTSMNVPGIMGPLFPSAGLQFQFCSVKTLLCIVHLADGAVQNCSLRARLLSKLSLFRNQLLGHGGNSCVRCWRVRSSHLSSGYVDLGYWEICSKETYRWQQILRKAIPLPYYHIWEIDWGREESSWSPINVFNCSCAGQTESCCSSQAVLWIITCGWMCTPGDACCLNSRWYCCYAFSSVVGVSFSPWAFLQ